MQGLRNVLAVLAGILIGGMVYSGLAYIGLMLTETPEAIDRSSQEQMTPFLLSLSDFSLFWMMRMVANALGVLIGAFVCTKIATMGHRMLAMSVGVFFLVGAVMSLLLLEGKTVYAAVVTALILPMAWLGWKLAGAPSVTPGTGA